MMLRERNPGPSVGWWGHGAVNDTISVTTMPVVSRRENLTRPAAYPEAY